MKHSSTSAGFSLVEVVVALGVASFCLIVLIALLPMGISTNQVSIEQTIATGLMAGVVTDLRSAPQPTSAASTASFTSPRYAIPLPRAKDSATAAPGYSLFLKEDGTLSGTLNANADPTQNPRYRVLLNFYPPQAVSGFTGTSSLGPTRVRILITWPALSDALVNTAPSKFTGSVETVVQLNRNWLDR